MLVAASSPPTLIPIRISGKRIGGMTIAGWRSVCRIERRAISKDCWTITARTTSSGTTSFLVQLAPGLGQEDVVERRLVQLQVGHAQVGGVQRAHDRDQVLAALQPHGGRARAAPGRREPKRLSTSATASRSSRSTGVASTDGRPISAFSALRRALGDDVPGVDDPDAVGQHVGLLEVLRGEEDGHAVLAREPGDLGPQVGAASTGRGPWSARRGTARAALCTSASARSSRRFMPPE